MSAIPAAALAPERNMLGMAHTGPLAALTPIFTMVSARITPSAPAEFPAHTNPRQAARQGIATCHVRSSVRSEWRAQMIMAATATKLGAELSHPMVIARSEEHTSELQSLRHLVCRLL